jgi:phosphoribosylformylglycinamidine synthase
MGEVMRHADRGGYVLGVCNGFQILTESGLLPGALLHNESHKFICKNVHLRVQSPLSPITAGLEENGVFQIPIAHGEGRFHANEEVLKELNDNGQVLFRYCTAEGSITPEANPNGAAENIAGITNRFRNVMGMMPHPERAVDGDLGNTDGIALFESLFAHMVSVAR